ncbi:impB/mucB/samB family protein [Sarocladium implicatum]|nr:impB/mucB/samB family protein [Sarocladium implicatum]
MTSYPKLTRSCVMQDYDCFYAQVHENRNPALKSLPLGIRQKNILATCNYHARRRGVRKLMLVSEARRICPDLVIVLGEDLTFFRDASKKLFSFLRSFSWSGKAEKLGFDEVFLDVTDIVEYNLFCLNKADMCNQFFQLSEQDPLSGFPCDLSSVSGCIVGTNSANTVGNLDNPLFLRLLLASHLAHHLRQRLEEDFGYTSTCGISTNKVLSKLSGSKNKPRNQTTLLNLEDDDAAMFIGDHKLRQIPGLGHKMAQALESYITGETIDVDSHTFESVLTAKHAREHPDMSPALLEKLLGGPGSEKGIGTRVWALLHGVDHTEVKEASDVPSQISIEDTYKGLETLAQITDELHKLASSLVRRLRADLLTDELDANVESGYDAHKWMARPKTLRLTIRSWPAAGKSESLNYASRISRSGPLPNFLFDLKVDVEAIASRLVSENLLPLLRRLQSDKGQKWNLQLMNVCAANMVVGAAEDKTGAGRDIANMFRIQDDVLRPWKVEETGTGSSRDLAGVTPINVESEADSEETWSADENPTCRKCGHAVPAFALPAHMRFHELEHLDHRGQEEDVDKIGRMSQQDAL